MFEELNAHRQAVRENIEKAFEIGFTGNNDLEKARQVGDIHPNGKWVWTQLPSGKYDWRVIKKTSDSAPAATQKTTQSRKKSSKPASQEMMEEFMDILKQSPYHRDSKRQFDSMSDSELKKFKDLAYKCSNDENLNQRTREECEKWGELANKEIENRSENKSNDNKGNREVKIDNNEYKKQYDTALKQLISGKDEDKNAVNFALNISRSNISKTKKELKELKENRPGAKKAIQKLESDLVKFYSQEKAFNDALKDAR